MRRTVLLISGLMLLAGVTAPAASATPRFAAPGGSGDCSTADNACSLSTAITGAVDGDEVIVAPGTYPTSATITSTKAINVHGVAGAARPRVSFPASQPNGSIQLSGRATLRHVEIDGEFGGFVPIIFNGELMEDVVARSGTQVACTLGAFGAWTVTVRNTVCSSTVQNGLFANYGNGAHSITLRNVTSYGTANTTFSGSTGQTLTLTLTNSILRPGVSIQPGGGSAAVTLRHDNFASKSPASGSLSYDDDGSSQTSAPLFVNAATGDFHQEANSPTVNGGADDPANGLFDLDGDARTIGLHTDIGADEYAPAPTAVTGSATGVGATTATPEGTVNPNGAATAVHFEWGTTPAYGNATPDQSLAAATSPTVVSSGVSGLAPSTTYHFRVVATSHGGTALGADQTFTTAAEPAPAGPGGPGPGGPGPGGQQVAPDTLAPVLGAFRLANRTFAVGPDPTAVVARAKRGSAFRFSLSEPATAVIVIDRATRGIRKGRRCVKPTRGARGRRCTRYVKAGTLTRSAVAGPNTFTFSGRIGRRALRPATYRATATATDAAGNRSEPAKATFKIVPR